MSKAMKVFDRELMATHLKALTEGRELPESISRQSSLEQKTALILHLQTKTMVPSETFLKRLETADSVVLRKFLTHIESLYGKKPINDLHAKKTLAALIDISKVDQVTLERLFHSEKSDVIDVALKEALQESLGRDGIEKQLQQLGLSKRSSSWFANFKHFSGKALKGTLDLSMYSAVLVGVPPPYLPKIERLNAMLRRQEITEQIAKDGIDSVYPLIKSEVGEYAYMQAWWQGVRSSYLRAMATSLLFYGVYEAKETYEEVKKQQLEAAEAEAKRTEEAAAQEKILAEQLAKQQEQASDALQRAQSESLDDLAQSLIDKLRAKYDSDTNPEFVRKRNNLLKKLQEIKAE